MVSLTFRIFRQGALHKATITLASLTLNPQHMPSKARSESGVVALPHPGSAKVSITYCARKCTDQFHAHHQEFGQVLLRPRELMSPVVSGYERHNLVTTWFWAHCASGH